MSAIGAYNYVLPHGSLNALLGTTPSTATEVCVGILKSPLCYFFGWTTDEEPPFSIAYREARMRVLGSKYGVNGLHLSGDPHLSEEEDLAGYRYWLGHASELEFEQELSRLDTALALQP